MPWKKWLNTAWNLNDENTASIFKRRGKVKLVQMLEICKSLKLKLFLRCALELSMDYQNRLFNKGRPNMGSGCVKILKELI